MLQMAGAIAGTMVLSSKGTAGPATRKSRRLVIGRQPFAASSTAITRYLMESSIFQHAAADFGYDITLEWRDFPNAQPMMELLKSGANAMAFGFIGNTPVITGLVNKLPIQVVTSAEGTQPFYLLVRPDSAIKSLANLRGKTVGTIVGADPQNALVQLLRTELNASPTDLDIKFVNFPSLPLMASLPRGVDASGMVPWSPAYTAIQKGVAVALVDSLGRTGPAYEGGAGKILPSIKKSPYFPEGFYEYRPFWVCHSDILSESPELISAWLKAYQTGLTAIKNLGAQLVATANEKDWDQVPSIGARIINDDLQWKRGWIWLVEGDAVSIVLGSQGLAKAKAISGPLTWDDVKAHLRPIADMQKKVWESIGKVPAEEAFTVSDDQLHELRGFSVWQMEKWGRYYRRSIPG